MFYKQVIPCAGGVRRDVDPELLKAGEWYTLSGFEVRQNRIVRGPGLADVLTTPAAVADMCVLAADYAMKSGTVHTILIDKSKIYKLSYNVGTGAWSLVDITGAVSFGPLTGVDYVNGFSYNDIFYMTGLALGWAKWTGTGDATAITGPPAMVAGGVFFDHLVGVNTVADPQSFQWASEGSETAWTPSTTNDAGAFSLTATPGANKMFLPLDNYGVVYKSDGIVLLSYAGGNEVFAISKNFDGIGIYNPGCVTEIEEGRHFGFGPRGPFIFNGQQIETEFALPVRDSISALAHSYVQYSGQVQYLRVARQLMVAFPTVSTYGHKTQLTYKYHLDEKAWSGPHYQRFTRLGRGVRTSPVWGSAAYDYMVDTDLYLVKEDAATYTYNGTAMTLTAETGNIPLWVDAFDTNGQPVPLSHNDIYQIQQIHLELYTPEATKSGLRLYISVRKGLDDAITWSAAQTFTYTADGTVRVPYRATGRWLRLKWDISEDKRHELRGYKIEFTRVGRGR